MLSVEICHEIVGFMNLAECQNLITLSTTMYDVVSHRIKLENQKRWLQLPDEIRAMFEKLCADIDDLEKDVRKLCLKSAGQEDVPMMSFVEFLKIQFGIYLSAITNNKSMLAHLTQETKTATEYFLLNHSAKSSLKRDLEDVDSRCPGDLVKQMEVFIEHLRRASHFEASSKAIGRMNFIRQTESSVMNSVHALANLVTYEQEQIRGMLARLAVPGFSQSTWNTTCNTLDGANPLVGFQGNPQQYFDPGNFEGIGFYTESDKVLARNYPSQPVFQGNLDMTSGNVQGENVVVGASSYSQQFGSFGEFSNTVTGANSRAGLQSNPQQNVDPGNFASTGDTTQHGPSSTATNHTDKRTLLYSLAAKETALSNKLKH